MSLSLHNINRTVNGEVYLNEICLNLSPDTFNVILGHTLSGKTSLLRMIAGLDRPDAGQIKLFGKDITRTPVQDRNVSMVYQQFINYPHLTVFDNIASPLRVAGKEKKEIQRRVNETAELLHIQSLLERFPLELSGGQQQRTAMARALVKDASLVLFDEPLVNLDYKLREELRGELAQWFRNKETIVVYATTEPAEALAFNGMTTLLHQGRCVQSARASDLYVSPSNFIAAELLSEPSLNRLSINDHPYLREHFSNRVIAIRPEHLNLDARNEDDLILDLVVDVVEISGSETFLHLRRSSPNGEDVGQRDSLVARLRGVHRFEIGSTTKIFLPIDKIFTFERDALDCLGEAANG